MPLGDYAGHLDQLRRRGVATAPKALDHFLVIVKRTGLITDALNDYTSGKVAVVAVPFDEVITTVQVIAKFFADYGGDLSYPAPLFAELRAVERAMIDLQALRRVFASRLSLNDLEPSNVFHPGPAPLIPYRLRQGDSLERLALATLASVERLHEIVQLNSLVYPYLDTTRDLTAPGFSYEFDPEGFDVGGGGPDRTGVPDGVLVTGDVLYLPPDAVVATPQPIVDLDTELWGRDIQVIDGEPQIDALTGEFVPTEGLDNMIQALKQRVGSMRGDLLLHPDYGMTQLLAVGIEGNRSNALVCGIETTRTVKQDPRVTGVRNLHVFFEDTVNRANMNVGLIGSGSREIPLNLVVPDSLVRGGA